MKKRQKLRRKAYLALMRKKKNRENRVIIAGFLLIIFGGTAATLAFPKRDFSDRENRALKQFPKVSLGSVMSGEFEEDYETYLSDQFPLRDRWIQIKAEAELLMGKQEINGIYYAKDDYLIESHKGSFDTELAAKNITYLSDFMREQEANFGEGRITAMVVPNAVEILKEKLPENAPDSGEAEYLSEVESALPEGVWFDGASILEQHKEEYIFYRTDHHWTTAAAFYVYEAWAKDRGFTPAPMEDYTVEELTDDFKGTIESKVGTDVVPDVISRFVRNPEYPYTLDYNNGQETGTDLYDMSVLETKDQYSVFFGGNQPIVKVSVENGRGRRLLVIKDSYAHCFLPFTFELFSEVDFIDLRYFNQSLKEYLAESDYTDLLFLYNASGFAEDTSLIKLQN